MNQEETIHMELSASAVQVILAALYRLPYADVAQTVATVSAFIQKHRMEQEKKKDD